MAKCNYKLVEVNLDDIHPGRDVKMEGEDELHSFPVFNRKGVKMALVPSHMMEVFLATFPLG